MFCLIDSQVPVSLGIRFELNDFSFGLAFFAQAAGAGLKQHTISPLAARWEELVAVFLIIGKLNPRQVML